MGKGRIVTAHGEGRYTIELIEDRARAEASRTLAQERITWLDGRIAELETDLAAAQGEVDSAAEDQDQAIAAYQAALADDEIDTAEAREAMVKAGEKLIQAAAKRNALAGNIRGLKVERMALQRRIDRIDALPALRQQEAWCADYTEDLSGEVATAEVPGEVGQVLVRPGYEGAADYDPARDGAIQPALSSTPAAVFYNLAMLPGWQRWRPTYRIATIDTITADLCDITLDAASSSQQGLGVNAQASYSDVAIMYMDCHGAVFEPGDKVLVAFSGNTGTPLVVGFASDPRPCCVCERLRLAIDFVKDSDWLIASEFAPTSVDKACAESSLWVIHSRAHGFPVYYGKILKSQDPNGAESAGTIVSLPEKIRGYNTNTEGGTYKYTLLLDNIEFEEPTYYTWNLFEFTEAQYPDYVGMAWEVRYRLPVGWNDFYTGWVDDEGYLRGLPAEVTPDDEVLELILVIKNVLWEVQLSVACNNKEEGDDVFRAPQISENQEVAEFTREYKPGNYAEEIDFIALANLRYQSIDAWVIKAHQGVPYPDLKDMTWTVTIYYQDGTQEDAVSGAIDSDGYLLGLPDTVTPAKAYTYAHLVAS